MLKSFACFGSAAMIALWIAFSGATPGHAQSVMKQCGDQWKAAKAAGTTNGQTWPQFLSQCRANLKTAGTGGGAGPATSAQPSPVPTPAPTYGHAPATGVGKTTSQCDAEYAANKAAIRASGQTKKAFVAECRVGAETMPRAATAAPAPAPAPAPMPAPAPSMHTVPAPPPAQAPAEPPYASLPHQMTSAEFSSDQQAHARCPNDTVVWVNTNSHVYHFAGTHNYGHTKEGAYMCEGDAKAAGDRAAMNERHP